MVTVAETVAELVTVTPWLVVTELVTVMSFVTVEPTVFVTTAKGGVSLGCS